METPSRVRRERAHGKVFEAHKDMRGWVGHIEGQKKTRQHGPEWTWNWLFTWEVRRPWRSQEETSEREKKPKQNMKQKKKHKPTAAKVKADLILTSKTTFLLLKSVQVNFRISYGTS